MNNQPVLSSHSQRSKRAQKFYGKDYSVNFSRVKIEETDRLTRSRTKSDPNFSIRDTTSNQENSIHQQNKQSIPTCSSTENDEELKPDTHTEKAPSESTEIKDNFPRKKDVVLASVINDLEKLKDKSQEDLVAVDKTVVEFNPTTDLDHMLETSVDPDKYLSTLNHEEISLIPSGREIETNYEQNYNDVSYDENQSKLLFEHKLSKLLFDCNQEQILKENIKPTGEFSANSSENFEKSISFKVPEMILDADEEVFQNMNNSQHGNQTNLQSSSEDQKNKEPSDGTLEAEPYLCKTKFSKNQENCKNMCQSSEISSFKTQQEPSSSFKQTSMILDSGIKEKQTTNQKNKNESGLSFPEKTVNFQLNTEIPTSAQKTYIQDSTAKESTKFQPLIWEPSSKSTSTECSVILTSSKVKEEIISSSKTVPLATESSSFSKNVSLFCRQNISCIEVTLDEIIPHCLNQQTAPTFPNQKPIYDPQQLDFFQKRYPEVSIVRKQSLWDIPAEEFLPPNDHTPKPFSISGGSIERICLPTLGNQEKPTNYTNISIPSSQNDIFLPVQTSSVHFENVEEPLYQIELVDTPPPFNYGCEWDPEPISHSKISERQILRLPIETKQKLSYKPKRGRRTRAEMDLYREEICRRKQNEKKTDMERFMPNFINQLSDGRNEMGNECLTTSTTHFMGNNTSFNLSRMKEVYSYPSCSKQGQLIHKSYGSAQIVSDEFSGQKVNECNDVQPNVLNQVSISMQHSKHDIKNNHNIFQAEYSSRAHQSLLCHQKSAKLNSSEPLYRPFSEQQYSNQNMNPGKSAQDSNNFPSFQPCSQLSQFKPIYQPTPTVQPSQVYGLSDTQFPYKRF